MTRDVMVDLVPEYFNITIAGDMDFAAATIVSYDPILNQKVPVEVTSILKNQISLYILAGDYPYLLSIEL